MQKMCFFYDLSKVQFVDNREIDNVNVKDFFLHVFKVLMAPESELFMFNETKTACWFPPKVRPCCHCLHLLFSHFKVVGPACRSFCLFFNQRISTAQREAEDILPLRRPVWSGSLQPKHRPPAVSAGSLQEAAAIQTLTGRHERVRPRPGRVRPLAARFVMS